MASTCPQMKPTQRTNTHVSDTAKRVHKDRVVVGTSNASRVAPIQGATRKSFFSKIKSVVAPPSKISRVKIDASTSRTMFRDVPVQERVKRASYSEACNASPSKIPRLVPSVELKRMSIFTKVKRAIGISKIPRLKRKDPKKDHEHLSPQHFMCRGELSSLPSGGDRSANIAVPAAPSRSFIQSIHVEDLNRSTTLVLPPVKPLNIVKKRSNISTTRPFMADYPRPHKPVASLDDIVTEPRKTTGHPANYSVAGLRHCTYETPNLRQVALSKDIQTTKSVDVAQIVPQQILPISGDVLIDQHTRQSTFSKIKQKIRKSAKSIFKPAGPHRSRAPTGVTREQSPVLFTIERTTTFVDIMQQAPPPDVEIVRKPTIIFPPATKPFRPRGSLPPISGLMKPDMCRSPHGICQSRRQGSAPDAPCICYEECVKVREEFAEYSPAILSNVTEDRSVPYFPRRRTFYADKETKHLLALPLCDEVVIAKKDVCQAPELVSRTSLDTSSSSISVNSSISISSSDSGPCSSPILDKSLENVFSYPESPSLSALCLSGDFPYLLDEELDMLSLSSLDNSMPTEEPFEPDSPSLNSLYAGDDGIIPEISLIEEPLGPDSPSVYSVSSFQAPSPSYSFLDEYYDTASLSPSPSSLDVTPESSTPVEDLCDIGSALDKCNVSDNHSTSSVASVLDASKDLMLAEKNVRTYSKKMNRSARILPSASSSMGLGINVDVGIHEHFPRAAIEHEMPMDSIELNTISSPTVDLEASSSRLEHPILSINTAACSVAPLEHPILSINTAACSVAPSIFYGSSGSATTPSQDSGDYSSSGKTSSSTISSVDFEVPRRSRRAAIYGNNLPMESSSGHTAIYGSVAPRKHWSPICCLSPELPICSVDSRKHSAVQDKSSERHSTEIDSGTLVVPASAVQYSSLRSAKRHALHFQPSTIPFPISGRGHNMPLPVGRPSASCSSGPVPF